MIETKTKKITELQELIESVEKTHTIQPRRQQPLITFKLTQSDKIAFAYDYYSIVGNTSILEVLQQLPKENKILIKSIIRFIAKYHLLKPYPNTNQHTTSFSQVTYEQLKVNNMNIKSVVHEYDHQNWLEPFDEDALFEESKTKHPSYKIFLDSKGNRIKFDKELSTKVKLAIINQGIIPARCIVEGAYPHVVKGTFQEYTDKIKTKTL